MDKLTCRSCWWQEGGRCYDEKASFNRDENGRSDKLANQICEHHTSKRSVLEKFIPGDMLIIASEHIPDDER